MFMLTLSKPGLKKLGAVALCGVLLAGAVVGVNHWRGQDEPLETAAQPAAAKIRTTQDIGEFFTARGFQVDLATASVDKVKIPKKWDDSFQSFNQVVAQSGMDLERYKGKTVEKWMALIPARSEGETKTYGVLLVHKQKPVGAYLLAQPGGEVTGLEAAAQTAMPLDLQQQEAAAQFGEQAAETAAEAPQEAAETAAEAPAPQEQAAETAGAVDEATIAAAGTEPVE